MQNINIIPNTITKNGREIILSQVLKFSLSNLMQVGSGNHAYVYVNDVLTWVLEPQAGVPVGAETNMWYNFRLKVEFRDQAGVVIPSGSLNVVMFKAENTARVDTLI